MIHQVGERGDGLPSPGVAGLPRERAIRWPISHAEDRARQRTHSRAPHAAGWRCESGATDRQEGSQGMRGKVVTGLTALAVVWALAGTGRGAEPRGWSVEINGRHVELGSATERAPAAPPGPLPSPVRLRPIEHDDVDADGYLVLPPIVLRPLGGHSVVAEAARQRPTASVVRSAHGGHQAGVVTLHDYFEELPPAEEDFAPAAPREPEGIPAVEPDGSRTDSTGVNSQRDSTSGPLGEAPEDISQIFLRQSSSLLQRGTWQLESGLTYLWQDTDALVLLPGDALAFQRMRDRRWMVPLTARYGLTNNTEWFGSLPVGLAHFERTDVRDSDATTQGGIGDAVIGLLHQFQRETARRPDVIGQLSLGVPTGVDPYTGGRNVAPLGDGTWNVTAGVNFVRSVDPVVLYGGMSYRHDFAGEFVGHEIQPGPTYGYSCGLGFAVNDDVALTGELTGAFQMRATIDGRPIANSSAEPVTMRLGLTRRITRDTSMQPFVTWGLTEDSPDFQLGFFLIHNVGRGR